MRFLTPVSFGNQPKTWSQQALEWTDQYFYLGGKKIELIPGHPNQGVLLIGKSPSRFITALKVISYFTVVLPVLVMMGKGVLRAVHTVEIIDPKQTLENGIVISDEILGKIEGLMPKILARQPDDELIYYPSKKPVFSLKSEPNLIFKSGGNINNRFENMVRAQRVCLANQLDCLVIPHARKFSLQGASFIAEERIEIRKHEDWQGSPDLNRGIRQLVTFIAETGFSDVEPRNVPTVDEEIEARGSKRIALVDLEEMDGARIGILGGGLGRIGLIGCLGSEEQLQIVLDQASLHGMIVTEEMKENRLRELNKSRNLREFYRERGILENPRQPIQIKDLRILGLNLGERESVCDPGERSIELEEVVIDVIKEINQAIARTPEGSSIQGQRYILLDTNKSLRSYCQLGCPGFNTFSTEEDEDKLWIRRTINALVSKGFLFELDKVNGHGYFIQA